MSHGTSFLWADTMTDLRGVVGSDSSSTSQPAILLGGYASPKDGGGGFFYWDDSSSIGDDGGTIIVPTGSTSGGWKRIYTGPIDIRWFGASPSAPDNHAAIQSAVKAATAFDSPSSTILIPAGIYKVTGRVSFPLSTVVQFLGGAVLSPSLALVTINGPITAPSTQQIFSGGSLWALTQSGAGPSVSAVSPGGLWSVPQLTTNSLKVRIQTGGPVGQGRDPKMRSRGTTLRLFPR